MSAETTQAYADFGKTLNEAYKKADKLNDKNKETRMCLLLHTLDSEEDMTMKFFGRTEDLMLALFALGDASPDFKKAMTLALYRLMNRA